MNARNKSGHTLFTRRIDRDCDESTWFREIRLLVPYGLDLNLPDVDGKTVLMEAAHLDYTRLARYVLKHGADVNVCDREGRTALIIAVVQRHTWLVRLLLEHGANCNVRDAGGYTALSLAIQSGLSKKNQSSAFSKPPEPPHSSFFPFLNLSDQCSRHGIYSVVTT